MYQNNGIVAMGLGGGAATMLLGKFTHGTGSIEIEVNQGGGGVNIGGIGSYLPTTRRTRRRNNVAPPVYDEIIITCLLYTSPSPRDATLSRMPSSA